MKERPVVMMNERCAAEIVDDVPELNVLNALRCAICSRGNADQTRVIKQDGILEFESGSCSQLFGPSTFMIEFSDRPTAV
jgi:hypothetical protein